MVTYGNNGKEGSRSDARPRRFGNIITVWPRHAYTERVSRSTRAPIPSTHFSRAYAIERGCSRVSAFLRGRIRRRNVAYLRDNRLELNECLLSREREREEGKLKESRVASAIKNTV